MIGGGEGSLKDNVQDNKEQVGEVLYQNLFQVECVKCWTIIKERKERY